MNSTTATVLKVMWSCVVFHFAIVCIVNSQQECYAWQRCQGVQPDCTERRCWLHVLDI